MAQAVPKSAMNQNNVNKLVEKKSMASEKKQDLKEKPIPVERKRKKY
jgi:hypothetical protein